MTLAETGKLIASIIEIWPSFQDRRDIEGTARLWQRVFADDDYQVVGQALGVFVATDTKGFPPVPGQLKEILATMMSAGEETMTEQEAWALVAKACRNGYYHAQAEFDKLPALCQQIVGGPSMLREWSMMDTDELQSVVASNFQRSYRVRAEREREYGKLPGNLRALMPAINRIGALPEARKEALPEPSEAIPMPDFVRAERKRVYGV